MATRKASKTAKGATMTLQEAGQRGGKTTAQRHGHEFYQTIGHKGGVATAKKHGSEFYREIGHRGGVAVSEEYGPEFYRTIGRRGGKTVSSEYGPEYYREIGRKGGKTMVREPVSEVYKTASRRGVKVAAPMAYETDFIRSSGRKSGFARWAEEELFGNDPRFNLRSRRTRWLEEDDEDEDFITEEDIESFYMGNVNRNVGRFGRQTVGSSVSATPRFSAVSREESFPVIGRKAAKARAVKR